MQQSSRSANPRLVASLVRKRIEAGGERLWRFDDFADLSMSAVAQALSRLARAHLLTRLSKGVYYRSRTTAFGQSKPNPANLRKLAGKRTGLFPSGLAAANILGFTSQAGMREEVATSAGSLPRKLVGDETIVHTRRPPGWAGLSTTDAALLDFLRQSGRASELSAEETIQRTLALLKEEGRFNRLLKVASTEPPRVRALLGALGEALRAGPSALSQLRRSLNPLSKFEFGPFAALPDAKRWHAKTRRRT